MPSFWETLTVNGHQMPMYASVPSSSAGFAAPYPAVLVAQHATGVDAFIQDICDRLAAEGYAAVAPNLYHRHSDDAIAASADGGPRPRPPALLSDPDIIADINAAVAWLRAHDAVQSDRIGVTGFCMGGRVAWLVAAVNPHIAESALALMEVDYEVLDAVVDVREAMQAVPPCSTRNCARRQWAKSPTTPATSPPISATKRAT